MCYATKRKIADCVKHLMRRKDITRITIHDIMDETHMSRQSFYYHFKDIYDVLEWIGVNDFQSQIISCGSETIEEWVCNLLGVLRKERSFYEKIAGEIAWPRIIECVRKPIEEQMINILEGGNKALIRNHPEEMKSCAEFFATSFCYYLLDYIYKRKDVPDKKVINDVRFMMMLLDGSGIAENENRSNMFPKVVAV